MPRAGYKSVTMPQGTYDALDILRASMQKRIGKKMSWAVFLARIAAGDHVTGTKTERRGKR